ncbi:hypothetical protein NMG60_11029707, partial [Bertholletia excelsa]
MKVDKIFSSSSFLPSFLSYGENKQNKVPHTAAARKTNIGRRKMAVNEVWMKEAIEEKEGLKGKTYDISTGATHNVRKYYELDHEGKKDLNVVVIGIESPRSSMWVPNTSSSLSSSGSNDRVSEDSHSASQKDESQRLLKAVKEISKLMQRDYRGKPLPRPPIHNNEPQ